MIFLKAFKYRIYPNREEQEKLAIQFGHSRFVYNHVLNVRKEHFKETGNGLSYSDTAKMLPNMKKDLEWLKEADSQVLQQKLKDLDRAYVNFFQGRAAYPKFKTRHADQSIRYPQRFKLDGNRIYLPKVGKVKIILHRPIEGAAKNVTVSKTKSGKYFASIQCETELTAFDNELLVVGVDLGIKDFAVLSTGEKIPHPAYLRKSEKKLAKLQRRLSKKKKGGSNRTKMRLKVARLHEKIFDRFFPSSKTCNICGAVNSELQLHHRFWTCDHCGTSHDRDINAAVNLKHAASTVGVTGTQACGEGVRLDSLLGIKHSSAKQEAQCL